MGGGAPPKGVSTGRGGAGNIGRPEPTAEHSLQTPVLKSSVYTTGRGGSGNMATNDDAAIARQRQDIGPVLRHEPRPGEVYHHGRGGDGNIVKTPGAKGKKNGDADSMEGENEELKKVKSRERRESFKERRDSFKDKGKEVLDKFRRTKSQSPPKSDGDSESAIS